MGLYSGTKSKWIFKAQELIHGMDQLRNIVNVVMNFGISEILGDFPGSNKVRSEGLVPRH